MQDDVFYLPRMRRQLVAARTVADALVGETTASQSSSVPALIPETARPREENPVEVARLLAAWRGDSVRVEGRTDLADPEHDLYESGALLPSPHAVLAGPTFPEWPAATPRPVPAAGRAA